MTVTDRGLLMRLRRHKDRLTEAEQRVIEWILDHPAKVVNMSAAQLAQACSVSEATVVRTCQRVGRTGFAKFKLALAFDLAESPEPAEVPSFGEVEAGDSLTVVAEKVFSTHLRALHRTLENMDINRFEAAVQAIGRARRLEVFAYGTHSGIVYDTCGKFINTGIPCTPRVDHVQQLAASAVMESGDVLIGFSHSGRGRALLQAVQLAKAHGATTIGVTNFAHSPLAKAVDIPLITHGDDLIVHSEAMTSWVAQSVLVDSLLTGVSIGRRDVILKNLFATRKAVESARL